MDAARLWRAKTDDEVLEAYQQLGDYTDEGQRLVRGELERRQLTPIPLPPPSPAMAEITSTNPIARLWSGGYSLPITYWVWGQVGSVAWSVAIALVGVATAAGNDAISPFALTIQQLSGLAFLGYLVLVGVGVWRSAGHYKGSPGWAALARVAVAAPVVMSVMRLIFVVFGSRTP